MPVFDAYAHYYNLLYRDKDYLGESEYIRGLMVRHCPEARTVLDLGCGTGRHDLLLAQMGYAVTGVDQSGEMLEVAKANRASLNPQPPSLNFLQGDLRSVRLGTTFDVVISLFHVMSYQTANEDLTAAIATARAHLKPGGIFIFDCWYGPAVLTDRPSVRVKRLEDEAIFVTRIAEPVMRVNDNLVEVCYQVIIEEKQNRTVKEVRETHLMRYLFRPELELFLGDAGLHINTAAEWMTGRQPGSDTWGVCFVVQG